MAAAVTAAGLIGTAAAGGWLFRQQKSDFDAALAENGQIVVDSVVDSVDGVIDRLLALASLYRASEDVTEAEFRQFTNDLGLLPGMDGMGYASIVESAELDSFLADARVTNPGFRVFELSEAGGRVPVEERSRYAPLLRFEPFDTFERPHGFDILSEPKRRAMLERAVASGDAMMTPFLRLVSDQDEDGFIIGWPIEEHDGSEAVSFVFAAMDFSDLVCGHLPPVLENRVHWLITDVTGSPLGTEPTGSGWSTTVPVAGRVWAIDVTSARSFGLPAGVAMLLLVGAAASLVGGVTAYLLHRRGTFHREMAQLRDQTRTKNSFLASVSHELRTPLTAVLGYGRLLQEDSNEIPEDDRRSMVDAIVNQADELEFLIQDLLAATRCESGLLTVGLVPISPSAEVAHMLDDLAAHGWGTVEFIDGLDETERAIADPFRFRQIIRNLLDNSHRHGGGQVRIRLESGASDVRIQIADNGSGVLPVDVERIFDPYQRTHRTDGQPESLGIGLSISRQLAVLMHGDLTYRREDQWTIFELTLPVGPRVQDDQPARQDATRTGSRYSI